MIRRVLQGAWAVPSRLPVAVRDAGRLVVLAALLVMLGVVDQARADLRPPGDERPPRPAPIAAPKEAPLVVRRDPGQRDSLIIIPRRFLTDQVGASQLLPPSDRRVDIIGTVVAGGFVSAALMCSLLLVVRKRQRTALAVLLLAMLAGGYGVTTLWADIPVPGNRKPRPQIIIQVTDQGDNVILIQGQSFPAR